MTDIASNRHVWPSAKALMSSCGKCQLGSLGVATPAFQMSDAAALLQAIMDTRPGILAPRINMDARHLGHKIVSDLQSPLGNRHASPVLQHGRGSFCVLLARGLPDNVATLTALQRLIGNIQLPVRKLAILRAGPIPLSWAFAILMLDWRLQQEGKEGKGRSGKRQGDGGLHHGQDGTISLTDSQQLRTGAARGRGGRGWVRRRIKPASWAGKGQSHPLIHN